MRIKDNMNEKNKNRFNDIVSYEQILKCFNGDHEDEDMCKIRLVCKNCGFMDILAHMRIISKQGYGTYLTRERDDPNLLYDDPFIVCKFFVCPKCKSGVINIHPDDIHILVEKSL